MSFFILQQPSYKKQVFTNSVNGTLIVNDEFKHQGNFTLYYDKYSTTVNWFNGSQHFGTNMEYIRHHIVNNIPFDYNKPTKLENYGMLAIIFICIPLLVREMFKKN